MTRRRSLLTGKLTRRTFLRNMGAVGLGLSGLGLAGCTTTTSAPTTAATTAPTAIQPVTGGTFNFAFTFNTCADPRYAEASYAGFYGAPAYEPLLSFDLDWNIVGVLATDFSTTDDMTYDIELREDVKFHDGTDFTSTDAATNFDFMRGLIPDQLMHRYRGWFAKIDSVDIIDTYNLQFHLEEPWGFTIGGIPFLNPTYILKDADARTSEPIDTPAGTGPYKVTEYVEGSHINYERFDDWWGAGLDGFWEGEQYFDNLHYKGIIEDSARIVELENGTVDGIYYQDDVTHKIVIASDDLDFVQHDDFMLQSMRFNVRNEPASDIRFREAVFSAIDFESVINIMHPKDTYVPDFFRGSPYEDANLEWPEYDPDHAEDLVEALVADGIDCSVKFPASVGNPFLRSSMHASYLQLVGIDCEIVPCEGPGWIMAVRGGNFDIAEGLEMLPAVNPWEFTYNNFYSTSGASGIDDSNWGGIRDNVLDPLCLAIQASTDPDVIHDSMVAWGERVVEMCYLRPEFIENRTYGFNKKVHGFQGDGTFRRGFPITDVWKES